MADSSSTTLKTKGWSSYMLELYSSRQPPFLGTLDLNKLEEKAREVLKHHPDAFLYTFGSAGTSSTYRANLRAFEKYCIVPRMLRDASVRDLTTTLFGVNYSSPLFIAPIGVQGIVHPDGELATARAAKDLGVPFIFSTASTRSIEEVALANGNAQRWFQLYWPKTQEVTLSLLKRAKENGYTALVVTLDTMSIGWRPHDLDTSYLPFLHGVGVQVGTSDPVFMARYNLQPRVNEHTKFPYEPKALDASILQGDKDAKEEMFLGSEWLREINSGTFRSWDDVKFLRDNWKGPLLLKGVQTLEDAKMALDLRVDGIIVSNHGGRQVDGALPSLYALDNICQSSEISDAQKTGKFTVLFDSGIRTGSDIIKAMALGAQGVLLGRPWMYGLMIGGQQGVEQVIKQTLADLDVTLGLSGYKNLAEIQGKGLKIVSKVDFQL